MDRSGGKLAARQAARTHAERAAQYERERAEALLRENRALHEALTALLLEKKVLDAAALKAVVPSKPE